ncbi:hypothetical protein [uncultured Hymenobacter sp.]|uniref:hypothetical protein n=1 Tax=uncultured Hymenobacter sp. TaxID=170016 RepID=UPI0035CC9E6D
MKKRLIKLCTLVLLSASIFSCEKDYGVNLGPVEDSQADIPVTVTNATYFERFPVVTTSVATGGNITIEFTIPAEKGRIKQITKVATSSATALNFGNLNSTAASTALNTAPIVGNGSNTITYTTTLADYLRYRVRVGTSAGPIGPAAGTPPAPTIPVPSTTAVPTDIGYYFLIELEDGTTIIPMPVRVRVIQ